jgi:hypothetical protein
VDEEQRIRVRVGTGALVDHLEHEPDNSRSTRGTGPLPH